jgi:hypothetical protein
MNSHLHLPLLLILFGCATAQPGQYLQVSISEGTALQLTFETTEDCLKKLDVMTKSAPPELHIRCSVKNADLPYGFRFQETKKTVVYEFASKDACEQMRNQQIEELKNSFTNSPFLDVYGIRSECIKIK